MCPNRNYSLSFSPFFLVVVFDSMCVAFLSHSYVLCGVYETANLILRCLTFWGGGSWARTPSLATAVRWAFIFNTKPIISSLGRYFYGFFFRVVPTRATVNSFFFPRVHCFFRSIFFFCFYFDQRNLLCRHVDGWECICLCDRIRGLGVW